LATAVLRAGLVIAALALGVFVLSKAFPTGNEAGVPATPGGGGGGQTTSPLPSPEDTGDGGGGGGGGQQGGGGGGGSEARDPSKVQLHVLNGTDVSGLADDTRQVLEDAGYRVLTVGDAQDKPYEVTVISYLKAARADAEVLRDQFFPGAELEQAAPNLQVDITVIIGEDYAASQGDEAA
jgi:hypothetical protein